MTRALDFENDKRQIKSFRMAGKVAMCSSLPCHLDGRLIMCLKKTESVFLNDTDCRYMPDTFIQTLG